MAAGLLNLNGHFEDAAVRDFLAVSDLHQSEVGLAGGFHKDRGDDKRAEIVPFA
jgi:hypothetical protein